MKEYLVSMIFILIAASLLGYGLNLTGYLTLPQSNPTTTTLDETTTTLKITQQKTTTTQLPSIPTTQPTTTLTTTTTVVTTTTIPTTTTTQAIETTTTQMPIANHVVISEFATRGPNGSYDEFVELYNPTNEIVNISGWHLQSKPVNGTSWTKRTGKDGLPVGSIILPYGFYLLASKSYSLDVTPDYRHTANWGFSDVGGHLRIVDKDGNVIDKVGYGGDAVDPEGLPITEISVLSMNGSLERIAGIDTDNNFYDFIPRDIPEPQNSSFTMELTQ